MNYKKQIVFSLIFALIIGAISAFFFNYLPFDCSDPQKRNQKDNQ